MKTIISFFVINVLAITSVVYADTNVKSKLFIQKDHQNTMSDTNSSKEKVDFFELAKKNEVPTPTPNWDASSTVNMSAYDRAQYYIGQNDIVGLNQEVNSQRAQTLNNALKRGEITKKEYDAQRNSNTNFMIPGQKSNSAGFTIDFD